jgi:hypothetical protein
MFGGTWLMVVDGRRYRRCVVVVGNRLDLW